MSTDYDRPWKEALDAYFEPVLALLFAEVRGHTNLVWQTDVQPVTMTFGLKYRVFAGRDIVPQKVKSDARINVRLPSELKEVIEAAAAQLGQSLSDYAVSTLVQNARGVLHDHNITVLSVRDRDLFVRLLDDAGARPNKALKDAAKRYRKHFG